MPNQTQVVMDKDTLTLSTEASGTKVTSTLDASAGAIKEEAKDIKLTAENSITLKGASISLEADQEVSIKAKNSISMAVGPAKITVSSSSVDIEVGPSKVSLSADGTEITGMEVSMKGTTQAGINAPMMSMEGTNINMSAASIVA